jgi:hypothetical protein
MPSTLKAVQDGVDLQEYWRGRWNARGDVTQRAILLAVVPRNLANSVKAERGADDQSRFTPHFQH